MKILNQFICAGLLLALMGCSATSQSGDQRAVELRGGYLAAQTITAQCTLTADYGQRIYEFGFDVTYTTEKTTLTLTQPETIQGLAVEVAEGGSQIVCDGVLIETGTLSSDGLTPITAIPAILDGLCSGYVQQWDLTEGVLTLVCGDPDLPLGTGEQIVLTLDDETGNLLYGEILVDGVRVIDCLFESISWASPVEP